MALDFNDENDRLKSINGSVAIEQGQMTYSTGKDGTGCAYFDGTGSGWLDVKNSNGQGLLPAKIILQFHFRQRPMRLRVGGCLRLPIRQRLCIKGKVSRYFR